MLRLFRQFFSKKDDIIIKQAFEIDRLRMQCDLYEQLAIIDANTIKKLVGLDDENN